MRESIGGTWLTGIVITFLALFAAFLTYSISYTKAFRVKNAIISAIEETEGFVMAENGKNQISEVINASDEKLVENGSTEAKIFRMIRKVGYNYTAVDSCDDEENGVMIPSLGEQYGYCVKKYCVSTENNNGVYYKITTYIALKIPIINFSVKIPIQGETNTMYYDVTGDENCNIISIGG